MCRISAVAQASRLCALAAVAVLLLASAALTAAEPALEAPWYERIFSSPAPKPQPQPIARPVPVAPKPLTRQDVSRSLDQEQKVFMERLQFCTKLRQVAAETNDDDLLRQADVIEQQATEVYLKRTNKLPNIVEDVKAAEANLERKRLEPPAGAAALKEKEIVRRAPNGRPIRE